MTFRTSSRYLRAFWLLALLAFAVSGCAGEASAAARRKPAIARPAAETRVAQPTPTPAVAAASPTPPPPSATVPSAPATPDPTIGTTHEGRFPSPALGAEGRYVIYLPAGYATSGLRYPVFYLLHGKGGGMNDWLYIKPDLDRLIADKAIPPVIAVLPDAPYSNRANYYVDSVYAGSEAAPRGEKVETALTHDLIAHIDATFRTIAGREGRVIGGYSMGGWGAMRYALAHPDLYRAAIVLSPAVYVPFPPAESGMRAFGAFGKGTLLFDETVYTAQNYPAVLERIFKPAGLPLAMFIAAGDDEHHYARYEDREHDMDLEAHRLYSTIVRVPNMKAELRILQGPHCWDVWRPAFLEAAPYVTQFLARPTP
jgi:enterochelin esterase-like enzyme